MAINLSASLTAAKMLEQISFWKGDNLLFIYCIIFMWKYHAVSFIKYCQPPSVMTCYYRNIKRSKCLHLKNKSKLNKICNQIEFLFHPFFIKCKINKFQFFKFQIGICVHSLMKSHTVWSYLFGGIKINCILHFKQCSAENCWDRENWNFSI